MWTSIAVQVSFLFTGGEPVVMLWVVRDERMVILAMTPISELELRAFPD